MTEARIYEPNLGNFQKGITPWNKGKKGTGRKGVAVKGMKGFLSRGVVAINQDGTLFRRFGSVEEARQFFGLCDRHTISNACRGKFFCRGYRLMYEEDYVPWADYHYRRTRTRDIYGRFVKGYNYASAIGKQTETQRQKRIETGRKTARRLLADNNTNFGKPHKITPVVCIETGEQFPSIKAASESTGIPHNYISGAISRFGKTCGLTFRKTEQ